MLNRIRLASVRMDALLDDLLVMSKMARVPLQIQQVDLSAMAEAIFDELKREMPGRSIELVIKDQVTVSCDPALMRVAITHLLKNAWKFTSPLDHAKIEFGLGLHEGKRVIRLSDNGVGFDMAYAGKLFLPFQRLHAPTEFPGNGIGLAIVARIVQRHGGSIAAESSLGKGASVMFTLEPAKEAASSCP
ncbi:MAG: hypothetical protein HC850_00660 [Rhodomicrobium sp.]|nr:hypothetical protein [Rhodomicrobium sp.]